MRLTRCRPCLEGTTLEPRVLLNAELSVVAVDHVPTEQVVYGPLPEAAEVSGDSWLSVAVVEVNAVAESGDMGTTSAALVPVPADPICEEMIDDIIAGGHPQQHPEDWDEADLNGDGKIEGETEIEILESLIDQVMDGGEAAGDVKDLERDRKGWYDRDSGRIVIWDPNGPGTGFIPDNPDDYWDGLREAEDTVIVVE